MFEKLAKLPADPILGLINAFQKDTRAEKVDLGVGVYKNEKGETPILAAVTRAEQRRLDEETTKSYIGPAGAAGFNRGIEKMLFGERHVVLKEQRVATAQTPGGCGALSIAAEVARRAKPDTTLWVSDPTWANHIPLLGGAGLTIKEYPYFDYANSEIRFDAMIETLDQVARNDLVLLHGCCHNPCGADLSQSQWHSVGESLARTGAVPFIDIAYQGFADGVEEDAYGVRHLADQLPEMIITSSCSKNFGLYRERTGAVLLVTADHNSAAASGSQIANAARGNYSMPPAHGAAIVDIILHSEELSALWLDELTEMRNRINSLRSLLADALTAAGADRDFSFLTRQHGMFSFLGISVEQVTRLREQYGIYMVDSSRINIAGINQQNVEYLAKAVSTVL